MQTSKWVWKKKTNTPELGSMKGSTEINTFPFAFAGIACFHFNHKSSTCPHHMPFNCFENQAFWKIHQVHIVQSLYYDLHNAASPWVEEWYGKAFC